MLEESLIEFPIVVKMEMKVRKRMGWRCASSCENETVEVGLPEKS